MNRLLLYLLLYLAACRVGYAQPTDFRFDHLMDCHSKMSKSSVRDWKGSFGTEDRAALIIELPARF
jgi:hypothetical protein